MNDAGLPALHAAARREIAKVIVGQDDVIEQVLVALFAGGHVLVEGVPGTAKTLLVRVIARLFSCEFKRVQFTPDLMPADIVGTSVYDLQSRSFRVRQGPVFTNILLADEINRAPAKVQAALLESMEERGVSLEGQQLPLPDPFMVLATQNPIEYEGTYPLPEAQQDRFLFKAFMNYPTPEQELEMLRRWDAGIELRDPARAGVEPIFDAAAVAECQAEARKVTVDERLRRYIIELAVATRQAAELVLGASPRAEVLLLLAAKAAAAFEGRDYVTPDDVKGLLRPTFRHRLLLRPEAEVGGQTADSLLDAVIARVTPPR